MSEMKAADPNLPEAREQARFLDLSTYAEKTLRGEYSLEEERDRWRGKSLREKGIVADKSFSGGELSVAELAQDLERHHKIFEECPGTGDSAMQNLFRSLEERGYRFSFREPELRVAKMTAAGPWQEGDPEEAGEYLLEIETDGVLVVRVARWSGNEWTTYFGPLRDGSTVLRYAEIHSEHA